MHSVEEANAPNPMLYWYILRVARDEEKKVSQIKEFIESRGLQKRIVDVRSFREYEVVEMEEYLPNSDEFPKRGFKSTKTSVWVKLSNGNYKRIKVVKKNPFGGMVFVKMEYDIDLFKTVHSWDPYFFFLNYPNPQVMSDEELMKLESKFNGQIPNLQEYADKKGYLIVEGMVSNLKSLVVDKKPIVKEEQEDEYEDESQKKVEVSDIVEKKSKIYSDLNISVNEYDNLDNSSFKFKKSSSKSKDRYQVNDMVFIKRLGFAGVIQEIDYELDRVMVAVSMFGRKQPVECKISEISNV